MTKRAIVLIAVLCGMGLSSWAGVSFTASTKHEGTASNRSKAQSMDTITKGWFDGGQGRIEFVQGSDNPMAPKGGYMLIKDAGKTMYMVNPAEKSYMQWDIQSIMGMAGGAMGMMNMKVSSPKVEKLLDEEGPSMLGCPTRHIKLRTSYAMAMSFMGIDHSSAITQEQELWTTEKYKDAGLAAWRDNMGMKTGDKSLDELIKAQMDKMQGVILKMITANTTQDNTGKTQTSRTIMEVTEIKEESVGKDRFEIPADYKEIPMGAMMPGMDALKQRGAGQPRKPLPGGNAGSDKE